MSSSSPRVLVTRPVQPAAELVAKLQQQGVQARSLPLFRIEPVDFELPSTKPDRVVFVSANAVACSIEILQPLLQQWQTKLFAIGPATAVALQSAGLQVQLPGGGFRSEELLQHCGDELQQGHTWVVCGTEGREQIQNWLTERGAAVDSLYCYRRQPLEGAAEALGQLADNWQPDYISLMSGDTLELFDCALTQAGLESWRDIALLVPSPRVLSRARQLEYCNLLLLEDASEATLLQFLSGLPRG